MKLLFTSLILTLVFGGFVTAINAQEDLHKISVRINKQKKASRSKLNVKFLELVEDSRCAEGTNCVWAGNAKIKILVKSASEPAETFELNTNLGAKGAVYGRYVINLTSLTPTPKANVRINRNSYTANLAIHTINR